MHQRGEGGIFSRLKFVEIWSREIAYYKEILSFIAIGLTFLGFVPYVRSIKKRSIKPHLFSWVIWGTSTFIVFLAQITDGAGPGAWPIGISGVITFYITWLAYQNRADVEVTLSDKILLACAFLALSLWFLTQDPLWTVILLTTVDVIGFGPTIRKTYHKPFEENLTFFVIFAIRNALSVLALAHISVTTALFPIATGFGCLLLIIVALLRRWRLSRLS